MNADLATQVVEAVIVKPGDTLVISLPQVIDPRQLDEFTEAVRAKLGDEVKVFVLGGAVGVYVLRAGEVAE